MGNRKRALKKMSINRYANVALLMAALGVAVLPGCVRRVAADPMPDAKAAMQIREGLASKAAASESGGGETQAEAKSTGWGSIKGRFVYDSPGANPTPKPLAITKDVDVCGKHPLVNESLLVDSAGGLANVVLYVRSRNVEVNPEYAATANTPAVLDNHDCHFVPHVLAMRTSQPFVIKNSDTVGHNTNAALSANAPFNVIVPSGKEADEKLASAEPTPATVTCNIHPWMKGYLVVLPHPYVAVSAKDGTFEIKDVPAGVPLEFQAWHEASTSGNGAVQAERPDLKWGNNGRFTVTLQPNEVMDLKEIKIPASSLAAQ